MKNMRFDPIVLYKNIHFQLGTLSSFSTSNSFIQNMTMYVIIIFVEVNRNIHQLVNKTCREGAVNAGHCFVLI